MNEQSKQPAAVVNDAFNEIEIEPLEDVSDQFVSKEAILEAKDEVQWVITTDAIKTNEKKDTEEEIRLGSEPESEHDLMLPIKDTPSELQNKDLTDVNKLLAELGKLEELENLRSTSKPFIEKPKSPSLPKLPGLPKPPAATTKSKDDSSVDVKQILEELKQLEEREKTRSSKPLPPLPFIEAAKTEKAKASKTEEKDESVDVNQLLDELRKLEEKAKKELEKKPLKSATGPLTPPVKSKQTSRLDASEDAAIKRTLAEMSFIEGNEFIAEGDRAGAVKRYRDACNYDPDNVQYILKLADLLAEESATKLEAEELLTKGMEAAPSNFELLSKLAELRGEKKSAVGASDAAAVQDLMTELKRDKMGRLKRVRFAAVDALTLPKRISLANQAIVGVILGIAIWSIILSIRTEPVKINLKLILPPDETSVSLNKINFEWQGAAEKFLLQVEENGEKVFERTVLETAYSLKSEDRALLKHDRRYTWRVVPCNQKSEPLPYVGNDFNFKTIK